MGKDKNRKLTREDFDNLLKLLINTNGKSLNDLNEEEISRLYERDVKPILDKQEKKEEIDYGSIFPDKGEQERELDEEEKQLIKYAFHVDCSNQYVLSKEEFHKFCDKMDEFSKRLEKTICNKINKKIKFSSPKVYRDLSFDNIGREILFKLTENYVKSMEINNESFIIACDSSLINRVLMYSSDTYNASNLKKSIADEFVLTPILDLLNQEALNKDFTKQTTFEKFYYHDSLYNWISIEQKVSFEGEEGSILIAAPENIWKLFLNEKSLPMDNEDCVKFNENTSYAVIASTSIRDEDISKIKVGDKIYFENKNYNSGIAIYKNKELIKDDLLLLGYDYGTYGVRKNFLPYDSYRREIDKYNLLVIVGEKERTEEEINKIKEREFISLETDLSHELILLYNYKPIAKGIFSVRNGYYCYMVDSIITSKEGV